MSFRIGGIALSPKAALGVAAGAVVCLFLLAFALGGGSAAHPAASPLPAATASTPYLASAYATPETDLATPDLDWPYQIASLSLKLLLVLSAIWGGAWAYRRLTGAAASPRRRHTVIDVLESKRLAQNQTIHVVKVGGKVLVVGSTASNMTVLSDVTGDPALEPSEPAPAVTEPLPFSAYLQPLLNRATAARISVQDKELFRRITNRP